MAKSTHPFVEKMNAHKAIHRAMRAGDEREKEASSSTDTGTEETDEGEAVDAPQAKRPFLPKRKIKQHAKDIGAPKKGVLTAIIKDAK